MRTIIILISLVFIGCGSSTNEQTSLDRYWVQVSGFDNGAWDWTLDLTTISESLITIGFGTSGSARSDRCSCTAQMSTDSSYVVSDCLEIGGYACHAQHGTHVFELKGNRLTVCPPNAQCLNDEISSCTSPSWCITYKRSSL